MHGKSIINVDIPTFNKLLAFAKKNRFLIYRPWEEGESISLNAFFEERKVSDSLLMQDSNHRVHEYIVYKDDRALEHGHPLPLYVSACFNKYYKIPKMYKEKEDAPFSAKGELFFNSDKNMGEYPDCYGYDINSSYGYALKSCILPNTNIQLLPGYVEKDEIGFNANGETMEEGRYALYRFKKLTGYQRERINQFVDRWYDLKMKSKPNSENYTKAKDMMNISIGLMQLHNCYMRSAVINFANKRIYDILQKEKDSILLSNTDSIVSTKKIDYLPLSKKIGEWKLEHHGTFRYINNNYQWVGDKVSIRGIPKSWLKEDFNILEGGFIVENNKYRYDYHLNKEVLINEEEENKD